MRDPSPPVVDHHQHRFSAATAALARDVSTVSAADLLQFLDEAGIRRAVVFSLAYQYGNPNRSPIEDEYAKVRAENDWTSGQVARFPSGFAGFCAVNPSRRTRSKSSSAVCHPRGGIRNGGG